MTPTQVPQARRPRLAHSRSRTRRRPRARPLPARRTGRPAGTPRPCPLRSAGHRAGRDAHLRADDRALFRFKPGYEAIKYEPALDWSAWNVQTDPVTEISTAPGTGGDLAGGRAAIGRRAVEFGERRKIDGWARQIAEVASLDGLTELICMVHVFF